MTNEVRRVLVARLDSDGDVLLAGVSRITAASVDYPGSLLDVRLRPGTDQLPEDLPEPERALAIAAAAGFPAPPGDDGRLAVRPVPEPPPALVGADRYVVLHPGARCRRGAGRHGAAGRRHSPSAPSATQG